MQDDLIKKSKEFYALLNQTKAERQVKVDSIESLKIEQGTNGKKSPLNIKPNQGLKDIDHVLPFKKDKN